MVRHHMQSIPSSTRNYETVHRMLAIQVGQDQREGQGRLMRHLQAHLLAQSLEKGQACD